MVFFQMSIHRDIKSSTLFDFTCSSFCPIIFEVDENLLFFVLKEQFFSNVKYIGRKKYFYNLKSMYSYKFIVLQTNFQYKKIFLDFILLTKIKKRKDHSKILNICKFLFINILIQLS